MHSGIPDKSTTDRNTLIVFCQVGSCVFVILFFYGVFLSHHMKNISQWIVYDKSTPVLIKTHPHGCLIVSAYKYVDVKMSVSRCTYEKYISTYEKADVFLSVFKKLLINTHT